jgi:hypothetical protein
LRYKGKVKVKRALVQALRLCTGRTAHRRSRGIALPFRDHGTRRKIEIYKNIILLLVFCGCETWSLTLREELRLRMFKNRVLKRIFGPRGDKVTREWRNYIMRSLVIYTPHPVLFG